MSDPFYDFNEHEKQINIFHVKEPIKGTKDIKNKLLHKEAYLFNVKDKNKPDINFPKDSVKLVDEKIYLSDTNEILLQKIANYCTNGIDKKDIYAWIDHKPEKSLLAYSRPIGIDYNDLEDLYYMNPLREKKIDDRFVGLDGSLKRNSKSYCEHHKILNHQFVNENYNIYFCTIEDCIKYSQELSEDENTIKNGYLLKYFPFFDESLDLKIIDKIKLIESQRALIKDYNIEPVESRPITLIYENRKKNILLDIFQIFQDYEVNDEIPYMKIQNDNYMDSYIKFYKDGINNTYKENKDKNITKDLFEKWNHNIYIGDGFMRPKSIDKNNTLTFVLYDKTTTNFAFVVIDIKGSVKLYFEKCMKIEKFNNKIIQKFIKIGNSLLNQLNQNLRISLPKILTKPSNINISYIYEISDYHIPTLSKLFQSIHTGFIMISNKEEKIHLLSSKCDDYGDFKKIPDFITLCKRINDISDSEIIDILEKRYGFTKKIAQENLEDWNRISLTKPMRYNNSIDNISIILEKVLDRIKITLYGIKNLNQLHECMVDINSVMGIYNEKRMIILYTYESDLGDGWEDKEVHNNSEKTREKALKMGANILDFVFTKNN